MGKVKKITSVEDLTPDTRNANVGSERGNGLIEKSLEHFGAGRSILADKHGNVIAGNKTLTGWVGLGTERIRVVQTDGHELVVVQRTDLDIDSKEGRALAIADNRAGELNLEWDAEQLSALAADYSIDLNAIGFTGDELDELKGKAAGGAAGNSDDEQKFEDQYDVLVQCTGEEQQREVMERLRGEGLSCRPVFTTMKVVQK